mmetsp:Transcript_24376/g.53371  ORF Transcript_24376/g.53371 Transcript_24376/m.53371 type:complete len:80 (-) Transcript_24376:126-365(-)
MDGWIHSFIDSFIQDHRGRVDRRSVRARSIGVRYGPSKRKTKGVAWKGIANRDKGASHRSPSFVGTRLHCTTVSFGVVD